jgi:HEAT repeat protein
MAFKRDRAGVAHRAGAQSRSSKPGRRRRRPDATQRLQAVLASSTRSELVQSLDDPSPEVARAAIKRLVEVEGERVAAELRARVLTADLSLVGDLAKALRQIGDREAAEIAIAGLREEPYTRRLAAARAAAALGDERAVEALRAALRDEIAGVRVAALDALAEIGAGEDTAGACATLLNDPDPQVRIAAVRAVTRTATRPGAIVATAADDGDKFVRLEVARHVAGLPRPAASRLLADPDLRVREAAASSAGIRQVDQLARLLLEDPASDVRHAAAKALGGLVDQRIAELLIPALEDPDAIVRMAVLRALESLLGRAETINRLCRELTSERPHRRRAIVYALAHLEALESASEVWRLVDDPDPDVRLALLHAARSLVPEPEPLAHYLATDPNPVVRHAAEITLHRTGCRER